MAYATLDDLLQVEPTIQDYGVLEWDTELGRSETEINRTIFFKSKYVVTPELNENIKNFNYKKLI